MRDVSGLNTPEGGPIPGRLPRAERILIIRSGGLGEVARSVPVLASLRAAYPEARIDWLVRDTFSAAVAAHPGLSNVVRVPREEIRGEMRALRWGKVRALARGLREPGYDMVFDCQGMLRSGLVAWATRAPVCVGHADAQEMGWLPLTQRVRTARGMHRVERTLALLEAMGIAAQRGKDAGRLYSAAEDREWLGSEPYAGRRYVVVAPTGTKPEKRWPAERFAKVAEHVAGMGIAVVVTGGSNEREQCGPLRELAERNPLVLDRVGATTVGSLMAVIEGSELVVCNDSGVLDIAVGFDRRIVALFGPTDVRLEGPVGREGCVIQHLREGDEFYFEEGRGGVMMERITVEEVVAMVEKKMKSDKRQATGDTSREEARLPS